MGQGGVGDTSQPQLDGPATATALSKSGPQPDFMTEPEPYTDDSIRWLRAAVPTGGIVVSDSDPDDELLQGTCDAEVPHCLTFY